MSALEIINVPVVSQAITKGGLKKNWLTKQLGLSRSAGYDMLRTGALPSDDARRKQVVRDLAKIIGLPVTQILVRLEAKESA